MTDADRTAAGRRDKRRRAVVITVSDGVAAGVREDASGPAVAARIVSLGYAVGRRTVADDRDAIADAIAAAAAEAVLVVTTGGTGLTPRDVTPEATLDVVERTVPGLAEAMRAQGRARTPLADLSRGIVGSLGTTLVVNLPGSPRGATESLAAIEPALEHAVETLAGPFDHSDRDRPAGPATDPSEGRGSARG